MSKRNFRIDANDQFLDRNYSGKQLHGTRNAETHISTTKSLRSKAFGCQKKVKLTVKDIDSSTSCRLEDSPIPLDRKEVIAYVNHPKTSEYAFFKKLKEDAGQICHSNSLQKDAHLSKKPQSSDCFRERTNDVRVISKCFNHSTLIENTPTVNSDSFLSPSGRALKKSEECPIGSTRTQKHFQGYGDSFQPQDMFSHEETQSAQGKTFFRKRQKLRQWVAYASFPDIDKLCSKGHDIVSMLLSRLFSNSNEENKYDYSKSGRAVTATRHDLLVSQELDIQYKERHHIPRQKLLELDSSSYSSDHLSYPMFHRSDDRISYTDFSTCDSHKLLPSYSTTEPEYNFDGTASFSPHCITDPACNFGETARFSANSVMTHGFLFNEQEHKTLGWNHLDEPGKLEREPYPLVLENGLDSPADEINVLATQESDIQRKEHHHIPRKKLLELDSNSYSSDHLSSPMFISDDRIISCADVSTYYSHKFHPSYSTTEPKCNFDETARFSDNSVTTHGILFNEQEHKSLAWNYFDEAGKHAFLLENGLDSPADEINVLATQESDIQRKEHHHIPRKKLLELDSNSYSSDHLSSPMFISDERIISCADVSTYYSHKFHPSYSTTEPECNSDETARFSDNSVTTHGILFNKQEHKSLAWNYFDEAGKHAFLLENGLDSPADEINVLATQESDIQRKEHHHIPRKKLLELDSNSYSSDHLSSPMFISDERIISCADVSTYYSHKFHPSYSTTEPECNSDETARFSDNSVTTHGILFNKQEHKSLAWNYFDEAGKHAFLLENGLDNPADEINIPINHNNAKFNGSPALLTSLGNCEEQMLNSILGARRLCSSSILPNQPTDLNLMLDSGLLRCQEYRFGKYVYKDLDTDFNYTSLSLSYIKDHLKLSEDCRSDNSCVRDSCLSPKRHLFRGTVSDDYHHHADADTEAWFSSSLNFISGRRCLSLVGPPQDHQYPNYGALQLALTESMSDQFHIKDLDGGIEGELLYQFREDLLKKHNSSVFHISMPRDKGCPFMLHSSDHISEEEQTHKMLL